MSQRQQLIEQIRQQSIQKRTQALREAVQKQASNAPIVAAAGASLVGGGGGGAFSYPDRVSVELPGLGSSFLCNTGDFYNDSNTPIYYGEIEIGGKPSPIYMYYNGTNWGLDADLTPPYYAIGPEGAQNLYGAYTALDPGAPNAIVSIYSGDPAAECASSGNEGSTVIAAIQGALAWSWTAPPFLIDVAQWSVTGTISGLSVVGSSDNAMTGKFILTDQGGGMWALQTSGTGSELLIPSGSLINIVSVTNATTTGGNPSADLSGSWSKFTGSITYTP